MENHSLHLLLSIFLLSLLLPFSSAEIKNLQIISDTRPMILFEKFGFTHSGHVRVFVSDVSYTSTLSQPDPSRLGFFLISEEGLIQVPIDSEQSPNFCVLDSHYIQSLFTFKELVAPQKTFFNNSYPVTAPNEYSLFFANCAPECQVTMAVQTEIYNLDAGVKDYLSADQTQLPRLYFLELLVSFACLGIWIYVCVKDKLAQHGIHISVAGWILMNALYLLCEAEEKHYVKVTGTPHGWDVLSNIFELLRVTLCCTVIMNLIYYANF